MLHLVPYAPLNWYKHMSTAEQVVWDRFVHAYPDFARSACYDIALGDRRPDDTELKPEFKKNADYLGAPKIDVLLESDDCFYVVEVKKSAWTTALGELWLYEKLFHRDYAPTKQVKCMIVTGEERPHVRELCEEEGYLFYCVGLPSVPEANHAREDEPKDEDTANNPKQP